jgi:ABC-type transport system involved in cytochrome c biogenesis permease subunit
MTGYGEVKYLVRTLQISAVIGGVLVLGATYWLFAPLAAGSNAVELRRERAAVPHYGYGSWHTLPVQQGRTMPFETACMEKVREITGRARFEELDPVAVALAWMLGPDEGAAPGGTDWERYPFILCDHRGLRARIYEHVAVDGRRLNGEQREGKHVAPADLRQSPGFDQLVGEAARLRREDRGKAHFRMTPEQLKAEEVSARLVRFDAIRGRITTRLFANALVGEKYLDLHEFADIADQSPTEVLAEQARKIRKLPDPFHLVALDRVPGSSWFSIGELQAAARDESNWKAFMQERLAEMPQRYISPDRLRALEAFQNQVRSGQGSQALEEVGHILAERRADKVAEFEKAERSGDQARAAKLVQQAVNGLGDEQRRRQALEHIRDSKADPERAHQLRVQEMRALLTETDEQILERMRQSVEAGRSKAYHPDDPRFRLLHLDYLESLYPEVYWESLAAQPFPQEEAGRVLVGFAAVRDAYRSGDSRSFEQASEQFVRTLRDASDWSLIQGLAERINADDLRAAFEQVWRARRSVESDHMEPATAAFFAAVRQAGEDMLPYPGVTTLPLEVAFNHTQPFLWAWILMLAATLAFAVGLASKSRVAAAIGFVSYLASMALQMFGFFTRIVISGRAPVGNMYETVIWAAFMAALFALILELVYRRKVIALGGSLVATLGLVLADQMPLALDPKISPLVPVLRTNYWLTIHVLTIVSSYAAGTLAWGLGNITLALLAFGKGRRDTLHMLSHFTYRAMQITVLLLAAGTFLGGWWAAESWGRFWGWDPKEVGALIALVCYVVPLHARYIGFVKDFGLAVAAVVCYAAVLLSWYVVNFVLAAGLHSYGFGAGGGPWVLWAVMLNIEWIFVACLLYLQKTRPVNEPRSLETTAATVP